MSEKNFGKIFDKKILRIFFDRLKKFQFLIYQKNEKTRRYNLVLNQCCKKLRDWKLIERMKVNRACARFAIFHIE